jgi:hypothetical protein
MGYVYILYHFTKHFRWINVNCFNGSLIFTVTSTSCVYSNIMLVTVVTDMY